MKRVLCCEECSVWFPITWKRGLCSEVGCYTTANFSCEQKFKEVVLDINVAPFPIAKLEDMIERAEIEISVSEPGPWETYIEVLKELIAYKQRYGEKL